MNNLNKVLRYYKVHKYRLFEQENTSTIPDVYIGKHCQIGMNCHFMPGVKIMNCVTIGDNVAIHANTVIKEGVITHGQVGIAGHISIGSYSVIKAKSGVSHSCPEKSDLFGYPAKNTREYNKNLAVLNNLTKQHGVYKQ